MNNLRRVILLRHCQSIANGGHATTLDSIALSDSGFKHAEEIARGMHEPPDVLVSSPILRALQTIKPISTRFSLPYEIWSIGEFVYLNFGQSPTTAMDRLASVTAHWDRLDPNERNSECESFRDFYDRVCEINDRFEKCSAPLLILVSHGQFIRTLLHLREQCFPRCDAQLMADVRRILLSDPIGNGQMTEIKLGEHKR